MNQQTIDMCTTSPILKDMWSPEFGDKVISNILTEGIIIFVSKDNIVIKTETGNEYNYDKSGLTFLPSLEWLGGEILKYSYFFTYHKKTLSPNIFIMKFEGKEIEFEGENEKTCRLLALHYLHGYEWVNDEWRKI